MNEPRPTEKTPVDAAVGRQIRSLRLQRGLTQRDLGRGIGVRFQQIQKYEIGLNRVSASNLWRIAKVLDVPVVDLFAEVTDDQPSSASLPDHARTMMSAYLALPKEKQTAVRRLVVSIAKQET